MRTAPVSDTAPKLKHICNIASGIPCLPLELPLPQNAFVIAAEVVSEATMEVEKQQRAAEVV